MPCTLATARVNFTSQLPPRPEIVPDLKKSVALDLKFQIPVNYQKGAGDTYFSGKMLARLARSMVVADQVDMVYCEGDGEGGHNEELAYCPEFELALKNLRSGVEVWLNGSAQAPFLYDNDWGGLISCGCAYNGEIEGCLNQYPDCPALVDAGQNFGNAYYNDHHFHYGYHIYAAAVVMKYDHVWARQFVEQALLYIRDIANPSPQDPFFPTWRHKDWCSTIQHNTLDDPNSTYCSIIHAL